MVITYYGLSCFKIQSGQFVLATDPFGPSSGLRPPRFQADIALISHDNPNHNAVEQLKSRNASGDKEQTFIVQSPGEYEYQSITIRGIDTFHDSQGGTKYGKNTVYHFEIENITLLHMGDFGEKKLPPAIQDEPGNIDILFIPVGGGATLSAKQAHAIIQEVEPNIVIPMHYKIKNLSTKLNGVSAFLQELDASGVTPQEKFTIKSRDLNKTEGVKGAPEIVVLKPLSE